MSIKEETRIEILKKLKGGENIKNLIEEYGVSRSSIYQWRSENDPKPISNSTSLHEKFICYEKKLKH